MSDELHTHASKGEDTVETSDSTNETTEMVNTADQARNDGDSLFFTATVDAAAPLKLNITNANGDVQVFATDSTHLEITATSIGSEDADHSAWFFGTVDNEITLRPNWQVSNQLGGLASKIKSQFKDGFDSKSWSKKDFTFGMDVQYDLLVRVPASLAADSEINVKTANGDLSMKDVKADVYAKSANGDVSVANIGGKAAASTANGDVSIDGVVNGSIEANTANGDIQVSASRGSMGLRTANGDVVIRESEMTSGRLATVGGDVSVRAALSGTGTYAFDSVSGKVQVVATVPAGGARFTAKTVSGDIVAAGELESIGKREWQVGEGNGPQISAKTVSGDISVTLGSDEGLQRVEAEEAPEVKETTEFAGTKDVNINLDQELERAKGFVKELGTRLGQVISGTDIRGNKDETTVISPEVPAAPEVPEAPEAPAAPKAPESQEHIDSTQSETAARRARLLEAVKNGEMTVDEALAELDKA